MNDSPMIFEDKQDMDLMDTIESVLLGNAEYDAIGDYCDAMKKTPASLQELRDAIEDYDILELYVCLFHLFSDELNAEEKSYYRNKYMQIFGGDFFNSMIESW